MVHLVPRTSRNSSRTRNQPAKMGGRSLGMPRISNVANVRNYRYGYYPLVMTDSLRTGSHGQLSSMIYPLVNKHRP